MWVRMQPFRLAGVNEELKWGSPGVYEPQRVYDPSVSAQ